MRVNKSQGFTLMELMVTIVIIAILAAMSVGLVNLVKRSRLTAQINTLIASIGVTRSEAIKRGQTATICSSANGTSCSGAANWATGWIVFDDVNGDVLNGADILIRVSPRITGGNTLTYAGFAANDSLTFGNQGRFLNADINNGTFTLTDTTLTTGQKQLLISATGRTRVIR